MSSKVEKDDDISPEDVNAFCAFADEFKNESDRAAVILGAAKIDLILHEILRRFLVATPTGQDELLDGDAPLATFSSRINIVYRLGLIDAGFTRALHLIRRIRNAFAHDLSGCKLGAGAHADRVRELYAPFSKFKRSAKWHQLFFKEHSGKSAEFRIALAAMVARLEGIRDHLTPLDTSRSRNLIPSDWDDDVSAEQNLGGDIEAKQ
jgi:hypothetical protein